MRIRAKRHVTDQVRLLVANNQQTVINAGKHDDVLQLWVPQCKILGT
jgi:hypothetical protein